MPVLAPVPLDRDPSPAAAPVPLSTAHPEVEPRRAFLLGLLCAAVLLPRLALFPINENLGGDAVVRTELAQRWAAHPHWIASMEDGAYQFGPLHLYLVGLALELGLDKENAGRWVSLLFALLSVFPLYGLTRRLFGWRAAAVAVLGFAVWGMHLQMSTTAGSEGVALFFVLWPLALFARGLEERRFGPIAWAAVVLNLACAVRYDAWLLCPLLAALLFLGDRDRIAAVTRGVFFSLLCLPFPLVWMQGNERAKGDPLAPIHFIESFHRAWLQGEMSRWTALGFRAQSLVFWPWIAVLTLSPLVAYFGIRGMARVWKTRPRDRWLIWVVLVPTAYFTFRSAVLANFVPLGRFTVSQVALLLPFVWVGYRVTVEGRGRNARRAWAFGALLLALALPAALGVLTFRREDRLASMLGPVSPMSTNPEAVMQVARWLKSEIAPRGSAAIVDTDGSYWDLQVSFFSGLPDTRMARLRWDIFREQLERQHPDALVRIEGGGLEREPDFERDGARVRFAGATFDEVPGFRPPWHVYRREP